MGKISRRGVLKGLGVLGLGAASVPKVGGFIIDLPDFSFLSSSLERKINSYEAQYREKHNIEDKERSAWLVYSLNDEKFLANIRGDRTYQSASMIKPFVGLAYLSRCFDTQDSLTWGDNGRRNLEIAIQRSGNSQTNWLIDRLGGVQGVRDSLNEYYPQISREITSLERVPQGGRTYDNLATLRAYSRLCWQLARRDDKPEIRELKRIMGLPKRSRIVTRAREVSDVPSGTLNFPQNVRVFSKTGSTARCCGDFGLIQLPNDINYIIAGVIDRPTRTQNYGRWINNRGNLIGGVSRIVYDHIVKNS